MILLLNRIEILEVVGNHREGSLGYIGQDNYLELQSFQVVEGGEVHPAGVTSALTEEVVIRDVIAMQGVLNCLYRVPVVARYNNVTIIDTTVPAGVDECQHGGNLFVPGSIDPVLGGLSVKQGDIPCEAFRRMQSALGDMNRMVFAKSIVVQEGREGIGEDAVSVVTGSATAYIPMEELVDREKEMARLRAENEKMDKEIARSEGMLKNPGFVEKAPPAKVEAERAKLAKYKAMKEQIARF